MAKPLERPTGGWQAGPADDQGSGEDQGPPPLPAGQLSRAADADDDLSEQNVAELVKCIRLCLDCADVCTATVGVTSRQTGYDANLTRPLLEACAATCKSCGDECERHAQVHEHCRVCAEACRRCEQACRELLAALK